MKKTFLILLLCFLLHHSFAQETPGKLPELDILAGNWTVTTETRLSANGPWETNKGESVITKSTGTTLIEESYTGTLRNKSFFTKSLIAYDHFKDLFQRIFIDSEHGVLIDYTGEKRSDSLIFDKTWIYPDQTTVKLRVLYILVSANEFVVENMRRPGNMSNWDVTGRMRYVKKR
jgi:hypothetical protein